MIDKNRSRVKIQSNLHTEIINRNYDMIQSGVKLMCLSS